MSGPTSPDHRHRCFAEAGAVAAGARAPGGVLPLVVRSRSARRSRNGRGARPRTPRGRAAAEMRRSCEPSRWTTDDAPAPLRSSARRRRRRAGDRRRRGSRRPGARRGEESTARGATAPQPAAATGRPHRPGRPGPAPARAPTDLGPGRDDADRARAGEDPGRITAGREPRPRGQCRRSPGARWRCRQGAGPPGLARTGA